MQKSFAWLSAAALLAAAAPAAQSAEKSAASAPDAALQRALTRLESQEPLTAADHTALKNAAAARRVEVLRICGDPGNMPLSDIDLNGYQNKIVGIVAKEVGASVSYFWRPYLARGMTRQTLEDDDCDILLDIPPTFERVLATQPVYRTTYVMAWRTDSGLDIKSLEDPKLHDLKIGVYQTSAFRTALTKRGIAKNVQIHVLSHDGDLVVQNQPWHQVQKVVDGKLDIAGVWGPFAGWLKSKGAPITVTPANLMEDDIPLEFDLSMGLKKTDYILMYKLDLALEARRSEIEAVLREFGVPLVQCSRCVVSGDLPSHGIYTKPREEAKPLDVSKLAPDQRVTRQRLEAWLAEGADVNQELSNAVLAGDEERVRFLIEKGADINKLDAQGYAAIHNAARNRKPDLIGALVSLKADVNVPDRDGMTALQHAVMRDHRESVTVLAKSGAALETRNSAGLTPLALAIVEDRYRAAMALIEAGADAGAPSGEAGLTPLMLAAGKENFRPSLGAGKDRIEKLNPQDPGTIEIAKALLAKGADVNAVSASGVYAILLAAAHNISPMVGLLAQPGADLKIKSPEGKTAMDLARQNGNDTVVSLLKLLEQSGTQ